MAKNKSKKTAPNSKQIKLAESIPPLEYDPLDPSFNSLHRAGIAGLLLQIKAMEILRERVTDDLKEFFPKVDWSYLEDDDRGIRINFDIKTFRAVLHERYRGFEVPRIKPKEKNNNDKTKSANTEDAVESSIVPRLQYLEAFGADEKLQANVRWSYSNSFFSIPMERKKFFSHIKLTDKDKLEDIVVNLWNSLATNGPIELQKSSRPNIFGSDFKVVQLNEKGKKALLLHFWSLASGFFKPIGLKKPEKDKKTKQLIIEEEDRLAPTIVVPDVINVRTFVGEVVKTYSNQLNNRISTPLEAPLAFFLASRLAHNEVITSHSFGARSATVFSYKRPLKKGKPDFKTQPLVREVFDIPLDGTLLLQYKNLQRLKSYLYKAMRVENLLAGRVWHYRFDALVDKYPLEIFVPTQQENGDWALHPKARELAKDLANDFYYFANKENKMNDEETNIPALIDEIVVNYLRWRVYNRGQNPPDREKLNRIFEEKRNPQKPNTPSSLAPQDEDLLKDYNELYSKGINKEFVDFRGATDQRSFAELFIARFFEAGQDTSPGEREMLRPYYEGENWESGRWLVLMAISSAGAPKRKTQSPPTGDDADPKKFHLNQ